MKETVHVTVATTSVSKVKSLFAVNQLVREKKSCRFAAFPDLLLRSPCK